MRVNKVIAFQQYTSNQLTSAVNISSTLLVDSQGNRANAAFFSVGGSTGAIRWRDDGTAPTSNIGMRLPTGGAPYFYQGDLTKVSFITDSVPGANADVNIQLIQVSD